MVVISQMSSNCQSALNGHQDLLFMRIVLLSTLLCLGASTVASAADWVTQEVGPGVSVQFPGAPQREDKGGRGHIYTYLGEASGERYAMLTVSGNVPPGMIKTDKDVEEAIDGMVESLAKKGAIEENTPVEIQGRKARQLRIAIPGQTMRVLAVVANNYVHSFQYLTADETQIPKSIGDEFFGSVKVVGETAHADGPGNASPARVTDEASTAHVDPRKLGNVVGRFIGILILVGLPVLGLVWLLRRRRAKQK